MNYMCMHDDQGYFVGILRSGRPYRMSLEYFADKKACLEAIARKQWTRRMQLQFI